MFEEKKPDRAGFGSVRWIVRASNFLPLDRAALLRAAYNEYPERFPLVPGFPAPGRRGGSKPPTRTGTGGAESGGVIEGGEFGGGIGSLYPDPRTRESRDLPIGIGSQPLPSGGIGSCPIGSGVTIGFSEAVAAGVTVMVPSQFVPFPFLITHIASCNDGAFADEIFMNLLVRGDRSTDTGAATVAASRRVWSELSDQTSLTPIGSGNVWNTYPNFKVEQSNQVLTARFINNSAAAHDFEMFVDIVRL